MIIDCDIKLIVDKIRQYLTLPGSHRFNVPTGDDYITVRVSDHCVNTRNQGERLELSFISKRECRNNNAFHKSAYEWLIMDNGMTDTYEEIEDILNEYIDENKGN